MYVNNDFSVILKVLVKKNMYLNDDIFSVILNLLGEKKSNNALEELTKKITIEPSATNYLTRGFIYYVMKNYPKALEDLTKAISIKPNAINYYLRGLIYEAMEDYPNALEDFTRSIAIEEHSDFIYIQRGNVFLKQKKNKDALKDFNKAFELDKENFEKIITTYLDLNQVNEASEFFEDNVYNFDYDYNFDDEVILRLIEALVKTKQYDKATKIHQILVNYVQWYLDYNEAIFDRFDGVMQKKINETRIEERNRVMANLSHTIKNMLGTIINPLQNMKSAGEMKPVTIDNAIRGAELIRGLVNSMNLSFKGSIDDFIYDVQNCSYDNSSSIYEMFIKSIKYAISSMFDGKYFNKFMRNYFPTKPLFLEAQQKWNNISQINDLEVINSFLNKYLLKTTIEIEKAKDCVIGNDKGSSLKLLILIQEIILNAIKYSSFIPQKTRDFKIKFDTNEENVSIKVTNKYKQNVKVKSGGLGLEIINNFSKLLQTKPVLIKKNDVYSLEIKFKNLWRDY